MEYTTADFSLEITGVESKMRVSSFKGTEGLSQLYGFQIYLQSEGDEIKAEEMIGKTAVLIIENGPETRRICGILSRFWWIAEVGGNTVFYADLVPAVWLLTQRFDCRIFQNKSVPEIVGEVIKEAGITSNHLDTKLLRTTYPVREYRVQYRESDYNFIARLMEEEGIYFYFEHQYDEQSHTGHHTLVMVDAPSCHKAIDGKPEVAFHEPTGEVQDEEHVYEYHFGHQARPDEVTLRDFNYQRPNLTLQGNAHGNASNHLEIYDYPGEFSTQAEGDRMARARFEEMQAQTGFGSGRSNCCRFTPGFLFKLDGHVRNEFNKEYLLMSVQHSGSQRKVPGDPDISGPGDLITGLLKELGVDKLGPLSADKILPGLLSKTGVASQLPMLPLGPLGMLSMFDIFNNLKKIFDNLFGHPDTQMVYSNEFTCLPSQKAYRPPRATYKPAVLGPQTAMVVGPQGETCYMDELGRAKVKFHWDRAQSDDEKRTCFLRVAYPYAGADHGFQFHPLAGDEVVVTFLEGDPDKPLITGVVYNAANQPPLKPENRIENIILTPYQHRLLFDDRKASMTLNTGGNQTVQMTDGPDGSTFGNEIKISTADDHSIQLCKGTRVSGIKAETQRGQKVALWDDPSPAGLLLADQGEELKVWLNCGEKKILIQNRSNQEIQIDCRMGKVSVTGGGVEVVGGQVDISGSNGVKVKSGAKVTIEAPEIEAQAAGSLKMTAPQISLEGAMVKITGSAIELNAPLVKASTLLNAGAALQAPVVTATSVVASSYTPGAGNIL
jgi:uncharacterized protein involved in type VI secretion and phage assembly